MIQTRLNHPLSIRHHLGATSLALGLLSTLVARPAMAEAAKTVSQPAAVEQADAITNVKLENIELDLIVPASWEVQTESAGMSLVLLEPKSEEKVYGKPVYRRNLTLNVMHSGSPIDQKRANAFQEEISAQYAKLGGITQFQIVEHKVLSLKKENDAILVYSSYTLGTFPMMSMHILMANEARQYIFTYSDLAERFSQSKEYQLAYNVINSSNIPGQPIVRYRQEIQIGLGVLAFLFAFAGLFIMRARRAARLYQDAADEIYQDSSSRHGKASGEPYTQSMMWNLTGRAKKLDHAEAKRSAPAKSSWTAFTSI